MIVAEDLKPGQIHKVIASMAMTPGRSKVKIVWVSDLDVHYCREFEPKLVKQTPIERFVDCVNEAEKAVWA